MIIDVIAMCLAWNVYFESRSEPIAGQHAVAEVTITRASLSGRNLCEEVFLDRQFSWNNGDTRPVITNKEAWSTATTIAKHTIEAPTDFSQGATHYHANYIRKPKWAYKLCETVRIGRHIFYKPCEVQQ